MGGRGCEGSVGVVVERGCREGNFPPVVEAREVEDDELGIPFFEFGLIISLFPSSTNVNADK
jgi:hypothetical protein